MIAKNQELMNKLSQTSVSTYGIWLLAVSVIVQRLSVAVGNVLYTLSIICLLIHLRKTKFVQLSDRYNCLVVFGIFALCILPSVIFSSFFKNSISWYLNYAVYRPLGFFVALFLFSDVEQIKKIFKWIVVCFDLECLLSIGYAFSGIDNRAAGLGGSSLAFASCICMFLIVHIVVAYDANFSRAERYFAFFNIVLLCLAVIATGSRGGWVTFAVMFLLMSIKYLVKDWKKIGSVLLVVGLACIAVTSNSWMMNRYKSIGMKSSMAARVTIYQRGYEMFKDYPVVGIGGGTWRKVYPARYYRKTDNSFPLPHAHNNIIHVMAETGILGLTGYLVLMGSFIFYNLKKSLKKFNPYRYMIIGIILSFNCYGMIEYNFGLTFVMRTFWYLLASLIILAEEFDKGSI